MNGANRQPRPSAGCGAQCAEGDRLAAVLLRIRLSGLISSAAIADAGGLAESSVATVLAGAGERGLVVERTGDRPGWVLTAEGRRVGEKLLQHQLDCDADVGDVPVGGRRSMVLSAYEQFIPLNAEILDLCTRWQVLRHQPLLLNDHSDPDYDREIIRQLEAIHERVDPVCRMLGEAHPRFAPYQARLDYALDNVVRGQIAWLTKPTVDSYHTIWFELHDDFLATLGLDRAVEHARLHPTPEGPESENFDET